MNGRSLSIVEKIVCHYTPDSDEALDVIREWTDDRDNMKLELVPIDQHVTEEHFNRSEETLGVTLGGDGAFLEGVREFSPYDIPILGANTGTLAFLARVSPDNLYEALDEMTQGRSEVASRQRISVEGAGLDAQGINDVMIQTVPPEDPVDRKVASVDVYVDGEYVGDYTGSGVSVSTPTGSTGISLSAEGPIHYPSNNLSLQIVPLHTHKMGVRPIIVSSQSEITIVPKDEVQVMVDGGRHVEVADSYQELSLGGAETRANIIRTSYDEQFFTALTEKLGWGLRSSEKAKDYDINFDEQKGEFLQRAKDVAVESAESAGERLRGIHGNVENVEYKGDKSDMVTEADYKAQKIIKSSLSNEFPDHTILTEEDWDENADYSGYTWIIDPLDGTGNFMHGNPNYSISIGLLEDSESIVGVVYQPETNEVFHAIKGEGAYADGHPISTTDTASLDESMMVSGYDPNGDFIEEFYEVTQGVRAIGSSALNMCYVASGAADSSWEYDTQPWDVAAGLLILREAGGTATSGDGSKYQMEFETGERNSLVCTNGEIREDVCSQLQDSDISE